MSLTAAGKIYHRRVTVALEHIADSGLTAVSGAESPSVTIACTHSFSHHIVIPRFKTLNQVLSKDFGLHILTADYRIIGRVGENDADLMVTYDRTAVKPKNRVTLITDSFTLVCSPEFATTNADILSQLITERGSLPFLRYPNGHDWATWHDWFEFIGYPSTRPGFISIGAYVYLIEAAIDGQGLELGWRHYINHYLNNWMMVVLGDAFLECDRSCFVTLTKRGRRRGGCG